jgi:PilZ domain
MKSIYTVRCSKYIVCYSASSEYSAYIIAMHCTPGIADRRRAQRFRVTLPVELKGGMALTRDLSACGVFFETTLTVVPGQCLRLILVLEHIEPGRQVRLQCQGLVVRTEPCDNGLRVAVDIRAYRMACGEYDGSGCQGET